MVEVRGEGEERENEKRRGRGEEGGYTCMCKVI